MRNLRLAVLAALMLAVGIIEKAEAAGITSYGWEWLNPLPQGDRVSEVIWGNGEFLGIAESGSVQVSDDGQTWEVVAQLERGGYVDLLWDGERYITVTFGFFSSPLLWVSEDGREWTSRAAPDSFLQGIATNGSRYVFAGNNGSLRYSDDLENFTRPDDVPFLSYADVTWTGSQFIAMGATDTVITSPDAETWTERETGIEGRFIDLNSLDGLTVATGFRGATMVTTDGIDWTEGSLGNNASQPDTIVLGDRFYAAGGSAVVSSTDGLDWEASAGSLGSVLSFAGSPTAFVGFDVRGAPHHSADLDEWTDTSDCSPCVDLLGIATNGSRSVIVGPRGSVLIFDDINSVTTVDLTLNITLDEVQWDGQQFVAAGSTGRVGRSVDGETWTIESVGDSVGLRGILSTGTNYVAVGDAGAIYTSPDGVTWTAQTSGTDERLEAIAWSGDLYVATGWRGALVTSSDAVTWTVQDPGTSANLDGVTYGAGRFIAVGRSSTTITSTDGVLWERVTTGSRGDLRQIQWTGDQFIAVGDSTVISSVDGETWKVDDKLFSVTPFGLAAYEDEAVIVGRYGSILRGAIQDELFANGFE